MARAAVQRTRTRSGASRAGSPSARKPRPRGGKPIDLYYWPTPNGWKITIMLEECSLPYTVIPVDISRGDQFKPQFLAISPNNRMPAIVDHRGPDGQADLDLRVRRHLAISRPQDREVLSAGRASPRRSRPMAVLADGQSRPQSRRGQPLSTLCAGEAALCDRALRQ